ncbi:MAG: LamG-like jellyroll fold domain-containing protein, partial [Planctomycetota bacterium]
MEDLTQKVVIGAIYNAGAAAAYFADKIDNVILFNKTLSAAEVSALYNDGTGMEDIEGEYPYRLSDSALSAGWHFVVATYDSTGSTAAANGILLYVDGAVVDSTATNDAGYTAMENGAAKVHIGAQLDSADAIQYTFADKIDNVALFSDVLTANEISALYTSSTYEITTPYLTADLFELKFEQAADVMYITHPDYEPRRLSRLGHDDWTLSVLALSTGPFRDENTDTADTITASATTGEVVLTATGCTPFILGTTAGHSPNGALDTSKSQTGALFRLVHGLATPYVSGLLDPTGANSSSTLAVYKGITWDLVTNGTWGQAADSATIALERSYNSGSTYETVMPFTSAANFNIETSGTEDTADALYRLTVKETCAGGDACAYNLSVRDADHIGIVKIISVASPTSATGTVLTTLGSATATHRWSEGAFSNYRGWPIDVTISPEERLTFTGSTAEPLTVWGSVVGEWSNFKEGVLDDDAVTHTLIGSGQQNRIQWSLTKSALVLGTVGGEHILGASSDEEALTPSNVKAKLQTTYGSEDLAAIIVNQAVLFLQRGGRKIREFLYKFTPESEGWVADDLTVFSNHITESGIVDMAFQRTPDPTLWCVRDDGEMACMTYERDQDVFSWHRIVTHTNLAGTYSDSDFESVAVIYGGAGEEDEVWVTVRRTISEDDVRYIERFADRAMPSSISDMKYLDSFITDTGGDTTITGLTHLEGQTVQVLG